MLAELQAFPRTRSYPRTCSSYPVSSTSTDRKPATARKILDKDPLSSDNGLLLKWQKAELQKNRQEEKTKQESFARAANELQIKRDSRELGKVNELSLLQNNPNHITEKKAIALQRKETGAKESFYE